MMLKIIAILIYVTTPTPTEVAVCPVICEVGIEGSVLKSLTEKKWRIIIIFKLMRLRKIIVLLVGFLMFGTISRASDFSLSKLNLGNSQTEQESIVPTHGRNLPLQEEPGSTSSAPRATLEEDEDDTSKEKILLETTFVRSEFHQSLYFAQNIFETLNLEILTPPPKK